MFLDADFSALLLQYLLWFLPDLGSMHMNSHK